MTDFRIAKEMEGLVLRVIDNGAWRLWPSSHVNEDLTWNYHAAAKSREEEDNEVLAYLNGTAEAKHHVAVRKIEIHGSVKVIADSLKITVVGDFFQIVLE